MGLVTAAVTERKFSTRCRRLSNSICGTLMCTKCFALVLSSENHSFAFSSSLDSAFFRYWHLRRVNLRRLELGFSVLMAYCNRQKRCDGLRDSAVSEIHRRGKVAGQKNIWVSSTKSMGLTRSIGNTEIIVHQEIYRYAWKGKIIRFTSPFQFKWTVSSWAFCKFPWTFNLCSRRHCLPSTLLSIFSPFIFYFMADLPLWSQPAFCIVDLIVRCNDVFRVLLLMHPETHR